MNWTERWTERIKKAVMNPEDGETAEVAPPPDPPKFVQPPQSAEPPRIYRRGNVAMTGPATTAPVISRFTPLATPPPDPAFVQEIEETLAGGQQKGIKELEAQMEVLAAVLPDETTRLRAAIASLAATGLTVGHIKAAVQERIDLLRRYGSAVRSGITTELATEKSNGQQRLNILEQRVGALRAEIQQLEVESASLAQTMAKLDEEAGDTLDRFEVTYKQYHDELTALLGRLG